MNILLNLKEYFKKENAGRIVETAPIGICPNCFGKQEWDGEYYKFMKGQHNNPSDETYNSFIKDVARSLDKIIIKENTYTCETCKIKYDI